MEDITTYSGTPASGNMPHNGKLLKAFIDSRRLTQSEVARRMEVTASTLQYYYKSRSLTADIWWRASKALHYNFLTGLGSLLAEEYVTPREAEAISKNSMLQAEYERLEMELKHVKMELEIYKNIKGK